MITAVKTESTVSNLFLETGQAKSLVYVTSIYWGCYIRAELSYEYIDQADINSWLCSC